MKFKTKLENWQTGFYTLRTRTSMYLSVPPIREILIIHCRALKYSNSRISRIRTVDLTVVSSREIRHKILALSLRLRPRSLNNLVKMYFANKTNPTVDDSAEHRDIRRKSSRNLTNRGRRFHARKSLVIQDKKLKFCSFFWKTY